MNKLNKILAMLSVLMLAATGANSMEFKTGVSANGLAAYANAEEKLKDSGRITNKEAILATNFASIFVEVASDEMMGLGLGLSYAPEVVEMNKESRNIQPSATGDSGLQAIQADVVDLLQLYLTLPVGGDGAYAKVGYMQATMETNENLATGSKYDDVDMTGMVVGGGYEADLGTSGVFWRAEGQYQMWEDISSSGSEAGASTGAKNKISAEIGGVQASLSLGMKF
tara:strand:+ start:25 stop:702 length:678 start_codon:yes stop_codon:yes gene_type:complete